MVIVSICITACSWLLVPGRELVIKGGGAQRCLPLSMLPHIIHIMGDDIGWNDLGYHQGSAVSPRIDALARDGVRLTNHHAFKVCSPSRAAFHTGRLPWQMGMYDNSADAVPWLDVDSKKLVAPRSFRLLPELLAKKGYVSHAVGKWHLGYSAAAYTPTRRGYASHLGYYEAMTQDYWAHTHSAATDCPGPGLGGLWPALANSSGPSDFSLSRDNGTYESVLFGDRAVSIITDHAASHAADDGAPLFLFLAFHNEHDPHQAPAQAIGAFDETVNSDTYKVTAAQIATLDVQVGRVVDALNATGMLRRSVVAFSSDNGGPLDHANNWPRRGGKHTMYEGGLRTQAFVWASRGLLSEAARGSEFRGLMHVADWRATYALGIAGLTAANYADGGAYGGESRDQWAAIGGTAPPPRTELVHSVHSPAHYPGNCSIKVWGGRNCAAVITSGSAAGGGELKLLLGFVGDPRRMRLDEMAGEPPAAGSPVPFGRSGGRCGLAGFPERCDAPGKGGRPTPQPDDAGGCLHGCLFNLTADEAESHNLFADAAHAADVARLTARLAAAGATAPPWSQAPELADLSSAQLNTRLCDAARRAGGVVPIDGVVATVEEELA